MPAIYFECPDNPEPIGGIKQIYRQADVLNRQGIPAMVVHRKRGFRCGWFTSQAPVGYVADLNPGADDYLVLQATRLPAEWDLAEWFPGLRQVIFNQDCYLTFKDADLLAGLPNGYENRCTGPDTVAVITVSQDSARVLRYIFPGLDPFTVRCGIDPGVFRFGADKEPLISFVAKKSKILREILYGLRARGALDGYTVVPISNMAEHEVASVLRRSAVFFTAVAYEGFGLPPAEAMASGCIVIGYDGGGGREYFSPRTGFPVMTGDVLGFLRTAEDVLAVLGKDPRALDDVRQAASSLIASEYSLQREAESIVTVWQQIFRDHS